MGNISKTLLINISIKRSIMENIDIGADCNPEEIASFTYLYKEFFDVFTQSHEEMPNINPSIVLHEIKLYDDAKPIKCQIPSLDIVIELLPNTIAEGKCLLYPHQLDETR